MLPIKKRLAIANGEIRERDCQIRKLIKENLQQEDEIEYLWGQLDTLQKKYDNLRRNIMKKKERIHFDLKESISGSHEAKKFIEITDQIIMNESNKMIDEQRRKRDETWSILASQVIGSEKY
jgi:predicted nuclease with TOPRIM domain